MSQRLGRAACLLCDRSESAFLLARARALTSVHSRLLILPLHPCVDALTFTVCRICHQPSRSQNVSSSLCARVCSRRVLSSLSRQLWPASPSSLRSPTLLTSSKPLGDVQHHISTTNYALDLHPVPIGLQPSCDLYTSPSLALDPPHMPETPRTFKYRPMRLPGRTYHAPDAQIGAQVRRLSRRNRRPPLPLLDSSSTSTLGFSLPMHDAMMTSVPTQRRRFELEHMHVAQDATPRLRCALRRSCMPILRPYTHTGDPHVPCKPVARRPAVSDWLSAHLLYVCALARLTRF